MSDLEFFGGPDAGGESFDTAAFERFKERMKRAAAQLKALQKSEQRQKQTEDELIKILLKFIKSGKKKDQLILVTRLLEMNVPAGFIVSLLMISNKEIQDELKVSLLPESGLEKNQSLLLETFGETDIAKSADSSADYSRNLPDRYIGGEILPLKIKIAIANWINEITKRVGDNPRKVIKTVLDGEGMVQLTAIQLGSFCLREFMEQNEVPHKYEQIKDFVSFILSDIIGKAKEDLENRRELKEGD